MLTTPVLRCLHQQKDSEIHFLTKKNFQGILLPNPYIHQVHLLGADFSEMLAALRKEKFDQIIDLHQNLRSWRVRMALRAPSVGFDKINWQKWLMVKFKWNRLPTIHIVHRYLAALQPKGVSYDGAGLDYFIPPDQELDPAVLADQYFSHQENPRNLMAEGKYVALVIGAAHATKRLPISKIIAICKALQFPILLLGGPGDQETGKEIENKGGNHIKNTAGSYSLHQSASLVRQAALVITHDTGLMHIAAAFQKPIISIWGNTIPEFGMYPFYRDGMERNQSQEVKELSCRPCSKIGFSECPKGHFKCMEQIDVSIIVVQAHEKLLNP